MYKRVYLAGDNHSSWQKELQSQAITAQLAISFRCPRLQNVPEMVNVDHVRQIAGARCVEAINDALFADSELVVVRFDGGSDNRSALAVAGQAIAQGKDMVVLDNNVLKGRLASISRVATAVAVDIQQLLSILDAWSNNKAIEKN